MSGSTYDELKERGFIAQVSQESAVRTMLDKKKITFYIGFDSTAASLHAGSLVPIMAMMHLRRAGHRAIALRRQRDDDDRRPQRKDRTARDARRTDDPDARKSHPGPARSLSPVRRKGRDRSRQRGLAAAPELCSFLRGISAGISASTACWPPKRTSSASRKGCPSSSSTISCSKPTTISSSSARRAARSRWAGTTSGGTSWPASDLIRRVEGAEVEALTFPLLVTSSGAKMGKTAQGAVWLHPGLFSPYAFYQTWINCDDRDVGRFLRLYTFLPLEEIRRLEGLQRR